MLITNCAKVKLISFLGKSTTPKNTDDRENYWKLIGQQGFVIDEVEMNNGRILVLFD